MNKARPPLSGCHGSFRKSLGEKVALRSATPGTDTNKYNGTLPREADWKAKAKGMKKKERKKDKGVSERKAVSKVA